MPEWSELVKRRLGRLGLDPHREEEISSELADHLQDLYEGWSREGASRREAFERACEHVPDWAQLRREIQLAEGDMNYRTRTFWLPGLATLTLTMGLLYFCQRINVKAHIIWVIWPNFLIVYTPWLLSLPAIGALGAYWSRRSGGRIRERIFAALFPAAAMTALVLVLFLVALLVDLHVPIRLKTVGLATFVLNWVLIVGSALLVGALPFLKAPPRGPNPASEMR